MTEDRLFRVRVKRRVRSRHPAAALLLAGLFVLSSCGDDSLVERARRLQSEGRYDLSMKPLKRALRVDPDDTEALYYQAIAYHNLRKPELAAAAFKRAGADPELRAQAGVMEAEIHLVHQNYSDALAAAMRVLADFPDSPRALGQRARARVALGIELEAALADVARAQELKPESHELARVKAVILFRLNRFEEAKAALSDIEVRWLAGDKAIHNEKGALSRWCEARAGLATASGDYAKPEGLFGYCLREYKDVPAVRSQALGFYKAAGMDELVEPILQQMLEEQPGVLESRVELADWLVARGEQARATELLLAGERIADGVKKFSALWALVEHYEALADYGAAAAALESAIEIQSDPRLPFRLVDILVQDGQLDRAMELAEQLEGQVYIDLGVGRVLLAQGKPQDALVRFESGLEVWPENAAAHYFAAQAAEQIGNRELAIAQYREALRRDPEFAGAAAKLASLGGPDHGDPSVKDTGATQAPAER